jgi:hypothetical protein
MAYAHRTQPHADDQELNEIPERIVFLQEPEGNERNRYGGGAQIESWLYAFAWQMARMSKVVWHCHQADGKAHAGKL